MKSTSTRFFLTRQERRQALIEQIALERELVVSSCMLARRRAQTISDSIQQVKAVASRPLAIAGAVAAAVAIAAIGPRRSIGILKNAILGWNIWRSLARRD